MDLYSLPPLTAVLDAAYGVVMGLTGILEPVTGAASAAVAVIVITMLVRAALIPAGIAQARAERIRARLAPKLRRLRSRYSGDRERLHRETMRLYADEQVSPFAGCLATAAQAPVVAVIYALFWRASIAGHPNLLLTHELLGVPLGTSLIGAVGSGALNPGTVAVFAALVLAIGLVAEATRRLVTALDGAAEDHAAAATGMPRLAGALRFTTAIAALFVPLAAGVYLLVSAAWTLAQRLVLRRIRGSG